MTAFIIKRLISGIILLFVVSIGAFFLTHLAIGDPTAGLLGGTNITPENQAALAHKIGTDRPLMVQFVDWFSHAIRGDFGVSWNNFQSVNKTLAIRTPVTLSIVAFAILIAAAAGLVLGVLAGRRPDSKLDRVLRIVSVIFFALPGFWVSLILVLWFALQLQWFPATGYVRPADSIVGWLGSITLPAVSLSLAAIVMVAEQLRNGYVTANNQDFVRTLRSRGLSEVRVATHILRNACPPALTVLALMFVALISGAVVVELVFGLSGIGQLAQSTSQIGDIPNILGVTVVTIVFVVIVNFFLDLILGWVNPKARVQ